MALYDILDIYLHGVYIDMENTQGYVCASIFPKYGTWDNSAIDIEEGPWSWNINAKFPNGANFYVALNNIKYSNGNYIWALAFNLNSSNGRSFYENLAQLTNQSDIVKFQINVNSTIYSNTIQLTKQQLSSKLHRAGAMNTLDYSIIQNKDYGKTQINLNLDKGQRIALGSPVNSWDSTEEKGEVYIAYHYSYLDNIIKTCYGQNYSVGDLTDELLSAIKLINVNNGLQLTPTKIIQQPVTFAAYPALQELEGKVFIIIFVISLAEHGISWSNRWDIISNRQTLYYELQLPLKGDFLLTSNNISASDVIYHLSGTSEDNLIKNTTIDTYEQGEYSFQQVTSKLDRILSPAKQKQILDFEDMFLSDKDHTLRVCFNPQMSSFKTVVQEQKIETLTNPYPFFVRNGYINYKEMPIGGLISYSMDEQQKFLPELAASASNAAQEVYFERRFKRAVEEWLNNGQPKILRTPTEGNFIVRLMNVSLSPNTVLGRRIHSFTATAYEYAEYSRENLKTMFAKNIEYGDPANSLVQIFSTDPNVIENEYSVAHVASFTLSPNTSLPPITINANGYVEPFAITFQLLAGQKIKYNDIEYRPSKFFENFYLTDFKPGQQHVFKDITNRTGAGTAESPYSSPLIKIYILYPTTRIVKENNNAPDTTIVSPISIPALISLEEEVINVSI